MRTTLFGAGTTGLIAAAAGSGWYAVAAVGLALAVLLAATCWIVASRGRTRNAVALISAARSRDSASLQRRSTPNARHQGRPSRAVRKSRTALAGRIVDPTGAASSRNPTRDHALSGSRRGSQKV